MRSQTPLSDLHSTAAWVLGLLWGLVGTWAALVAPPLGILLYGLLGGVLVLRARARSAVGGGLLLATGLWFAYWHQSMIDRCAAMNSASGSCTVIDANGTLIPALTFVFVGAALSVYALVFGKRSLRGGE